MKKYTFFCLETFKRAQGIQHVIFGDIFLEDLRRCREAQLALLGMKGIFPLWQQDTHMLSQKMIQDGFKTIITCVDLKKLSQSFAGRKYDSSFLEDLPENINPCGENGEFHSFVYDGPIFQKKFFIQVGEIVQREGFAFADLLHRK